MPTILEKMAQLSKETLPDRLKEIEKISNPKIRSLTISIAMKNNYICELEAEIERLKNA